MEDANREDAHVYLPGWRGTRTDGTRPDQTKTRPDQGANTHGKSHGALSSRKSHGRVVVEVEEEVMVEEVEVEEVREEDRSSL
ncbi:unnamed protein product [Merluccius merluccius]